MASPVGGGDEHDRLLDTSIITSRRQALRRLGSAAAFVVLGGITGACSGEESGTPATTTRPLARPDGGGAPLRQRSYEGSGGSGSDADVSTVADPQGDNDGSSADPKGDSDVTQLADPADADQTVYGDPVGGGTDNDVGAGADPVGGGTDSDVTVAGDPADSDATTSGDPKGDSDVTVAGDPAGDGDVSTQADPVGTR
jgi:hypothetical protein